MAKRAKNVDVAPKDENSKQWQSRDEQMLRFSVDAQISATDKAIKSARNPKERSRLKEEQKRLKELRSKIDSGNYGSSSLYEKLAHAGIAVDAAERGRGSVSRYDTMDFKFDEYFRQTRYYGAILPVLLILFTAILVCSIVIGGFLPASVNKVFDGIGMPFDSVYTFKLSAENDFIILNTGDWPNGLWASGTPRKAGVKFVSPTGDTPSTVRVYSDLGMTAIKLSAFDVMNAFFRTKLMAKYKIDAIEDLSIFEGADWFYAKYMLNQDDYLTFGKQADGTYNTPALIYILALYGTIISFLGIIVCAVCCILSSIISMFTYTGRRIHAYAAFMLIFVLLALLLPAFLAISSGLEPSACLAPYFTLTDKAFLKNDVAQIKFNLPLLIAAVPAILVLILPKLFKNRPSKLPTYVPKGNRPPSPSLVQQAAPTPQPQPQKVVRQVQYVQQPGKHVIGKPSINRNAPRQNIQPGRPRSVAGGQPSAPHNPNKR